MQYSAQCTGMTVHQWFEMGRYGLSNVMNVVIIVIIPNVENVTLELYQQKKILALNDLNVVNLMNVTSRKIFQWDKKWDLKKLLPTF